MANIITDIQLSGITYQIQGSGGGITVDPTLDSGSTNPVANSAITTALDNKVNVVDNNVSAYTFENKISGVEYGYSEHFAGPIYIRYTGSTSSSGGYFAGNILCYTSEWGWDYIYLSFDLSDGQITATTVSSNYFDVEIENGEAALTFKDGYYLRQYDSRNGFVALTKTTYESGQSADVIEDTVYDVFDKLNDKLDDKQDTLVSSQNIKTINNESILGSGNINIQGGGKAIEAGRGISITTGETADTVSFNLSISAGTGTDSVAEGNGTTARGINSHAEGDYTTAAGMYSHAEGSDTIASGESSHSEGDSTIANGDYSHTEGYYTEAKNNAEHASGWYNVSSSASTTFGDSGNTLFSVGNGTSNSARHNAFEIRQNGDIYLSSGGTDIKLQDHLGGGGSSYTAGDGIDITNDVISVTGKVDTSTYNTYTAATDTALASKADTATTYTKTEVDTALASKQTTLTAGTGISIVDNVISATGGGGGGMTEDDELLLSTALTDLNDRKIDASEVKSNYQKKGDYVTTSTLNTRLAEYETKANAEQVEKITAFALNDLNDRFGGLKIVKITETEYAALATKDENTLYIVVADPS